LIALQLRSIQLYVYYFVAYKLRITHEIYFTPTCSVTNAASTPNLGHLVHLDFQLELNAVRLIIATSCSAVDGRILEVLSRDRLSEYSS
jgi:hypothetical protein